MQHTLGPWRIHKNGMEDQPHYWTIISASGRHIATFPRLIDGQQERQALDAQVIAAATSLLHACRLVTETAPLIAAWIKESDPGAFAQIQSAIKKATQP